MTFLHFYAFVVQLLSYIAVKKTTHISSDSGFYIFKLQ